MNKIPLEEGKYYHIYNRGNNRDNLFYEKDNYIHFLRLYEKYIDPIADTYAWVLLKNHFHLLVYIKMKHEIDMNSFSYSTVEKAKDISASRQFSNLFNAYTQAINKRHKRTGSLFEKPFERKLIDNERYFKNMIYYIHNNPVKHGFTKDLTDYPWSSYGTNLSKKPTHLQRQRVLDIFSDTESYKTYHSSNQNMNDIQDFIIE